MKIIYFDIIYTTFGTWGLGNQFNKKKVKLNNEKNFFIAYGKYEDSEEEKNIFWKSNIHEEEKKVRTIEPDL